MYWERWNSWWPTWANLTCFLVTQFVVMRCVCLIQRQSDVKPGGRVEGVLFVTQVSSLILRGLGLLLLFRLGSVYLLYSCRALVNMPTDLARCWREQSVTRSGLSGPCLTWEGSLFRTWCLLLRQWMETKPTLNNNIWLQDKQTFLQRKEGAFFFRPLGSPEMQNMVRLKSHFPSKPSESSPDVTEL